MSDRIRIADPVARALARRRPVVALESTLVTHGLPQPEGLQAGLELESEVMDAGAMPATVAVLGGALRVGLTREEMEQLASGPRPAKANLSNLAALVASGEPASTTVAATLFAASRAGIEVFATGGIGGVHRGAAESGDVSGDLEALARFPVAVVCAGAKAILDLPQTVERLETLGVPVLGFGTGEFPAFYRRDSGLPVDRRIDDLAALAAAIRAHFELGLGTGVVVANPIPAEDELPREVVEPAMAKALAEAEAGAARGRDATPFLLDRLRELTQGRTVVANRALLRNNVRVAARLAAALTPPQD
jgi:pseudouridine-5'-phosphate glycosidase